jgi:tetratricopeptide (TPR) repeat protein
MPPEAQRSFDLGLVAVEKMDWPTAARHFEDAHKHENNYPPIYLNVALANEKAGKELIAIAWFNAFLSIAPNAANAATVREEIERQKTIAKEKIEKILSTGRALNQKFDQFQSDRDTLIVDLIRGRDALPTSLIKVRDYEGAAAAVEKICDDALKQRMLLAIADGLMNQADNQYYRLEDKSDLEQASTFLAMLTESRQKSDAMKRLGRLIANFERGVSRELRAVASARHPNAQVAQWLDVINHEDFQRPFIQNPLQALADVAKDFPTYSGSFLLLLAEARAKQLLTMTVLERKTTLLVPRSPSPCKEAAALRELVSVLKGPGDEGGRKSESRLAFIDEGHLITTHSAGILLWHLPTKSVVKFTPVESITNTEIFPKSKLVASATHGKCSHIKNEMRCSELLRLIDTETGKVLNQMEFAEPAFYFRALNDGKTVVRSKAECPPPPKQCTTTFDAVDLSAGKNLKRAVLIRFAGDAVVVPQFPEGVILWGAEINSAVWNVRTGNKEKFSVRCGKYLGSSKDNRIAVCREQEVGGETVELRSFATGARENKLPVDGEVLKAKLTADNNRLLVLLKKGKERPSLKVIEVSTGRVQSSWTPSTEEDPNASAEFSPDATKLGWIGDKGVYLLDLR